MATVKPIDGRSIHQIQSGQVIVDLCSVVKELVENSLDASATSIDVRFKNQGLESVEVQDNGDGISPGNYETIALKHYTSKLSTYEDLSSLQTFGFRGEALSSLCALSKFHVSTARASDEPRGTKLDFDVSGKLTGTSVVASQRGTTVVVDELFRNLPVRRRELEKNIKREYGKVLGVLHAYACVSTGVRFAVSNLMAKGKKTVVFSTKSNPTTKENIANVYGAKTLQVLVPLDLTLAMKPTKGSTPATRNVSIVEGAGATEVRILGHISRPAAGEGRQTPDRQMFFVNSRPCALPQVAKAVNEVYKQYNVTQSPFVFANLTMDTNAYDVNVSPDKRTILLHDQSALLDALKDALVELFEKHDQRVPQSQLLNKKLPLFKPLTVGLNTPTSPGQASVSTWRAKAATPDSASARDDPSEDQAANNSPAAVTHRTPSSLSPDGENGVRRPPSGLSESPGQDTSGLAKVQDSTAARRHSASPESHSAGESVASPPYPRESLEAGPSAVFETPSYVQDFNRFVASEPSHSTEHSKPSPSSKETRVEEAIPSLTTTTQKNDPGPVPHAFNRMRPLRRPPETATITIGDHTITSTVGGSNNKRRRIEATKQNDALNSTPRFKSALSIFAAPGTQVGADGSDKGDEISDVQSDQEEDRSGATGSDAEPEMQAELPASPSESEDVDESELLAERHPQQEVDDDLYVDESEKKAAEDAKVAQMIAKAEEAAAKASEDNTKRAIRVLKGGRRKDSTLHLEQSFETSVAGIKKRLSNLQKALQQFEMGYTNSGDKSAGVSSEQSAEETLSLTVSKSDFARMRIVGQFNLGFILAVRPPVSPISPTSPPNNFPSSSSSSELFIIDQHASDEKYNFERLQASTIVQTQRLVHPRVLDLTAIEEETVLAHGTALTANGFAVTTDESGHAPTGRRCRLVSLPMSREVVFDARDLEELIALLADSPDPSTTSHDDGGEGGEKKEAMARGVPRPAKVRRMFAMRACRGSVMVGRTLTPAQMRRIVRHMGELDKPWNCPHGRPTMRHLFGLKAWEGWLEGDGVVGVDGEKKRKKTDWGGFIRGNRHGEGRRSE